MRTCFGADLIRPEILSKHSPWSILRFNPWQTLTNKTCSLTTKRSCFSNRKSAAFISSLAIQKIKASWRHFMLPTNMSTLSRWSQELSPEEQTWCKDMMTAKESDQPPIQALLSDRAIRAKEKACKSHQLLLKEHQPPISKAIAAKKSKRNELLIHWTYLRQKIEIIY